jgi:hypothetical protein
MKKTFNERNGRLSVANLRWLSRVQTEHPIVQGKIFFFARIELKSMRGAAAM